MGKLWRSTVDGHVTVVGDIDKPEGGGDGVRFEISVDDHTMLTEVITAKDKKFYFELSGAVRVNSSVVFSVSAISTEFFDAVWLKFAIAAMGRQKHTTG